MTDLKSCHHVSNKICGCSNVIDNQVFLFDSSMILTVVLFVCFCYIDLNFHKLYTVVLSSPAMWFEYVYGIIPNRIKCGLLIMILKICHRNDFFFGNAVYFVIFIPNVRCMTQSYNKNTNIAILSPKNPEMQKIIPFRDASLQVLFMWLVTIDF